MDIPLTQGKVARIDDADWPLVAPYGWYAAKTREGLHYVVAMVRDSDRSRHPQIRMHRLIMAAPAGVLVDHRDGDPFNNRRENLRLATNAQNARNARKYAKATTSRFKDVSWHAREGRWRAQLWADGRALHLGYFPTEEEAALAYNRAAESRFGEFARLNVLPAAA